MLQKSNLWNTVALFFINPTKEQYLMEMSREINLAHTSLKKNLIELVKQGIVKETLQKKRGRIFPLYKADLDSKEYRKYKKIYNITSLLESGLVEFIEDRLMPTAIVVFGSYQKGEDTEESDIDIFVGCKRDELDVARFEKTLRRKIQFHFNENFSAFPKELKNNIINGVVLAGFLEGYR
ncbi:MAG: nucleotidyltransferase domain-containing protein [Candidatus Woesearchaeota archaeon]